MNLHQLPLIKIGLLITICTIFLISCNQKESNEELEQLKLEELKAKFHGDYKLISSDSEDAVDLNMDGTASTNLLLENPKLSESRLGIRILESVDGYHFFDEMWPMVSSQVRRDEVFDPNKVYSTYAISYDTYYNMSTCIFNEDYTSIQLLDAVKKDDVNTLISIEAIILEGNEIIKVKALRRLYTIKGWLTCQIESKYKRYDNQLKSADGNY
ncbi:hypothetical protein BZG02_08185 [Labilibaculum filiforme]|uniref:Uncharacterized protein n=1 Tax=Labilibaculum filiforme TaxID=1940526 RepID=A0A2N3I104_9BACT|nr:hypothetical protein [Labilibaculum filiforme]PKQ63981.1 hypothetical protein BZG02_08185 [Labilibaculum filiforme]